MKPASIKKASALGAAVATALGAHSAWALDAVTTYADTAHTAIVYFAGSTATDQSLEESFLLITGGLCTNANPSGDDFAASTRIDVYRAANQKAVVCTKRSGVGSAFTKMVFFKESNGGSGNSMKSVTNTKLDYLDIAQVQGTFTCSTSTDVAHTTTLMSYENHTGCSLRTGTNGQVPDGGIADVEPALLGLTPTQASQLTTRSVFGVVFSPAVSLNLYRALQEAEGKDKTKDDDANMPSLTESQLRSIYNNQIQDWGQLLNSAGVPITTVKPAAGATTTVGPAGGDGTVFVCRRGASSGTQASFQSQFSRQGIVTNPVVAGVTTFVEPDDPGQIAAPVSWTTDTMANGSVRVWGLNSSGDAKNCLDAFHDQNHWAIGVISTEGTYSLDDGVATIENPLPTTTTDAAPNEWRWIKTQGVAPTLMNVANGNYDFFTETVVNESSTFAGTDAHNLITSLLTTMGSPSSIAGINVAHRNTHGDGGLLAIPGSPPTLPVTCATMRTNPTNTQRRTINLSSPNNKVDSWELSSSVAGGSLGTCP